MNLEEYYDTIAPIHDRFAEASGWGVTAAKLFEAMSHHLKNPQKILDAGTGTGILAEIFKNSYQSGRVYGVDLSQKMLDVANLNNRLHESKKGDITALPYPDQEFDSVSACAVLNYVFDLKKAASEMQRVAKPGAIIGFTFESEKGMAQKQRTRRLWSPEEVREAFSGATILEQAKIDSTALIGAQETNILILQAP